jgi:hypothetical protein
MVSTHAGKATGFQKGIGRKEQAWFQHQDAGSSVVSYAFAATYIKTTRHFNTISFNYFSNPFLPTIAF